MFKFQVLTEANLPDALAHVTSLREAGRVLSATNRAAVEKIRTGADKLSYHPVAQQICELCDGLLVASEPKDEGAGESGTVTEAERSWEQIEGSLRGALEERFSRPGPNGERVPYIYPVATYADRVVFRASGRDGKTWQVTYSVADDGAVTLAEPVEVVMTFTPAASTEVAEAAGSEGPLEDTDHRLLIIEAAKGEAAGKEWDVVLIEAGLSKNGNFYPAAALKAATKLFEGTSAFADHATDAERVTRPERSIRDKVGRFTEVAYGQWQVGGRLVEGLKARFKVVAPWLRETLREAVSMGEPDFLGFSIDAIAKVVPAQLDGRAIRRVESISKVNSVDVVTDPAAGGRLVRLVASNRPQEEGAKMDPEKLAALVREQIAAALQEAGRGGTATVVAELDDDTKKMLAELKEANRQRAIRDQIDIALTAAAGLSDIGKAQLRTRLTESMGRRELAPEEIGQAVKEQVEYEAALVQPHVKPQTYGGRVAVGDSPHDKLDKGLQGFFGGADVDGVPRFRDLREAYVRWTGQDPFDWNIIDFANAFACKYDSHSGHKRVRESLARSSWGEVFADNLYVMMITEYRASAQYDAWRKFVSDFEEPTDFQTRHWVRIGGYGDLSTVGEQATYPNLTSPTDEEVTYAISKRGGLDDVSFETLVDGRSNRMKLIPRRMAQSAARTLYKFVLNLITTDNPTMDYDSVALYDAAHGNTGTTALSIAGLDAVWVAMRDQTAYNQSAEILGERNKPKYLIVPAEITGRALRIVDPSDAYSFAIASSTDADTGMDPHRFKGRGLEVHTYDQLTDATDWWVAADPKETPTIVMGFLNGQQEPELFVQDQPTVGSNFTADKTTFKVRHIYGGDILEHRSFYRQVVAG